jgi:ABC-type uncharacterized transport system, permease component
MPVLPFRYNQSMWHAARKWARIFTVFAQDALAYRAVAVIWILTDTIPTLVMPLIWQASYNGRATIGGFTPGDMTAYYLLVLGITNMVQCHVMWEIATDIKEGRFSAYLMRPFSYIAMSYLGFLAWRIMRTLLFVPIFLVVAFLYRGTLRWEDVQLGWPFLLALFGGHLVSFFITYPFGLLALYFVETRSLFNFWYIPVMIFNGQIAPLTLFPPALRAVAEWVPFRYTIAFPAEVLMGRLPPDQVWRGLGMQVLWIVLGYAAGVALWRRGLKRFTGVGL